VPGEHVKIEMRRDAEMLAGRENRIEQTRRIEDRIARGRIGQKIDQRNALGLRTRERTDNKIKIRCGEPRPTIRLNHRKPIISTSGAIRQDPAKTGRTIELPFTLSEPQTRFAAPRKLQQSGKQLMLRGLHVSIETEGRKVAVQPHRLAVNRSAARVGQSVRCPFVRRG
jgi:hypothetical protein